MIILKAVFENVEPSIFKKKIYLEIDGSRDYLTPAVNPVDLNLGDFSYAA